MEKRIVKTNIAKVEKQKHWDVKIWDIVKIEKKQYDWSFKSIIWQVKSLDEIDIKIATLISNWWGWEYAVEIFESELDNKDFKITFSTKEEIDTIIFQFKQKALEHLNEKKREAEKAEEKYSSFIEWLKILDIN